MRRHPRESTSSVLASSGQRILAPPRKARASGARIVLVVRAQSTLARQLLSAVPAPSTAMHENPSFVGISGAAAAKLPKAELRLSAVREHAAIVRTLVEALERFVQFSGCARSLAEQVSPEMARLFCLLCGAANHLAEAVREDDPPEERSGVHVIVAKP